MYNEFFSFKQEPFRLTPDIDFFLPTQNARTALAYMEYALESAGLYLLTGDVGCGKTTIINKIISLLGEDVIVAKVFHTQISDVELLQTICLEFGIEPFSMGKVQLLKSINDYLITQYTSGRRVILIIDEAQNLPMKTLEEIRLLTGLETDKDKLLSVILVGQQELNIKLGSRALRQLTQRIRLKCNMKPLSKDETENYIKTRVIKAGGDEGIFEPPTLTSIYEYTRGVPRLINILCDTALICAFASNSKSISTHELSDALNELGWVGATTKTRSHITNNDSSPGVNMVKDMPLDIDLATNKTD